MKEAKVQGWGEEQREKTSSRRARRSKQMFLIKNIYSTQYMRPTGEQGGTFDKTIDY